MFCRNCGVWLIFAFILFSCGNKNTENRNLIDIADINTDIKTIHVFVALCDNKYQGITPVSASLGNGKSPNTNLYWGALYGIRTLFKKSNEWEFIASLNVDKKKNILERIIFKHKEENYILVADAYDGQYIKNCTIDFLNSSRGDNKEALRIEDKTIGIGGSASLLAYIGHDGFMDFQLSETFINTDGVQRDVIILACYSKRYFNPHLENANVNPLLWTTNLMCPEAYTLHDALTGYIKGETNEEIRQRAAEAYAKYQKCSVNAAKGLLVTDFN